jgi:hypothetical protein
LIWAIRSGFKTRAELKAVKQKELFTALAKVVLAEFKATHDEQYKADKKADDKRLSIIEGKIESFKEDMTNSSLAMVNLNNTFHQELNKLFYSGGINVKD